MTQPDNSDLSSLAKERFSFTVFLSACVHAILILGVGFTYLGERGRAPAMEITLAQYRSSVAPRDADFLAQENQAGSGVTDEPAAPSTPFASDFNADDINPVRPPVEQPQPRAEHNGRSAAAENGDIAVVAAAAPRNEQANSQTRGTEHSRSSSDAPTAAELNLAIASLQAQLDLRRQEYAARPRRYTISSASTRRIEDAEYLDSWRRRIEAVGNLNYPEEARRQRLYGSLRLLVALTPDGRVQDMRILQSSGQPVLDQAAVQIVNLAAPFKPFPEELRAKADVLEIIRTWRFHEGNALTSY